MYIYVCVYHSFCSNERQLNVIKIYPLSFRVVILADMEWDSNLLMLSHGLAET